MMTIKGDRMKTVRNESAQPMYVQIKEVLKQRIIDGDYGIQERLPSESEMMFVYCKIGCRVDGILW